MAQFRVIRMLKKTFEVGLYRGNAFFELTFHISDVQLKILDPLCWALIPLEAFKLVTDGVG